MTPHEVGHLASFRGNVGDQLNHFSFRNWMESTTTSILKWNEFEIRDCFRGLRQFNPDFLEFAEHQTLIVIGGGNFFELWPENSKSGTSINLSIDELYEIRSPIFFNALGVDAAQGISHAATRHFRAFFNVIANQPNFFVTVRNDGSLQQLCDLGIIVDNVWVLPDAGFFLDRTEIGRARSGINIGINIAQDMPKLRYADGQGNEFLRRLSRVITRIAAIEPESRFTFFPHVFSDLEFVSKLLSLLPDKLVRERVVVEKYSMLSSDALLLSHSYEMCDLVIATRFHANLVPFGLGVPVIGIDTYPQIRKMFREINLDSQCITAASVDFEYQLERLIRKALSERDLWRLRQLEIRKDLEDQRQGVAQALSQWLSKLGMW